MTVEQVRHRRRIGLWVPQAGSALRHRLHEPGAWADVHAVGLTWPDAVTCLTSAGRFHGLPVPTDDTAYALVPHSRTSRLAMRPVRYALDPSDVLRAPDIAVTTLVRTVLDCIGWLPTRAAEELLIWVLTRRIVPHDQLAAALDRQPGLTGNPARRRLLALTADGAMSVAEHRLHRILQRAGITGWVADEPLVDDHGRVIGSADVLFPVQRLVLEVDGMAYHGESRFQSDRTRQNRLVTAGYTVLRFTWADLVERPDHVRQQVQAALIRLRRLRVG